MQYSHYSILYYITLYYSCCNILKDTRSSKVRLIASITAHENFKNVTRSRYCTNPRGSSYPWTCDALETRTYYIRSFGMSECKEQRTRGKLLDYFIRHSRRLLVRMGRTRGSLSQTLVFHLSPEGQRVDGAGNWRPFHEHVLLPRRTRRNISSRRFGWLGARIKGNSRSRKFPPFLRPRLTKVRDRFPISRFLPRDARTTIETAIFFNIRQVPSCFLPFVRSQLAYFTLSSPPLSSVRPLVCFLFLPLAKFGESLWIYF